MSDTVYPKLKPKPSITKKPPSVRVKAPPTSPRPNSVRRPLDLPDKDRKTDLASIVAETQLPQCVKVLRPFAFPGCETKLAVGDLVTLHFIDSTQVVWAVDAENKKYRLPVFAKQLYEMLPSDPRLDDKEYIGTESLINANPLPKAVRVLEAHYSDTEEEGQEEGDVISIKGTEMDKTHGKVLVGLSQGFEVRFTKRMTTSVYTTMISAEFLPMSEIMKHVMPQGGLQRVRLVDSSKPLTERDPTKERILCLSKVFKEKRVIATRGTDSKVFVIPLQTQVSMETTQLLSENVRNFITPLFPLINTSLDLPDITRSNKLPSLQQIPQPHKLVLEKWLRSWEGKRQADGASKQENDELQKSLINVRKEVDRLKSALQMYEEKEVPPERPPRPSKLQDVPGKNVEVNSGTDTTKNEPRPPPLSPRPRVEPPNPIAPETPPPIPRSPMTPETPPPIPRSPMTPEAPPPIPQRRERAPSTPTRWEPCELYKPDIEKNASDSGSESSLDFNAYEEVTGDLGQMPTSSTGGLPAGVTPEDLKQILSKKERMLVESDNRYQALQRKYEELQREKIKVEEERDHHVRTIEELQIIVDKNDVYDVVPRGMQQPPGAMASQVDGGHTHPGPSREIPIPPSPTTPKRTETMNVRQVVEFLKQLSLGQYADIFSDNEITGELLMNLDEPIMVSDLGMTKLHARKLCVELSKLKSAANTNL